MVELYAANAARPTFLVHQRRARRTRRKSTESMRALRAWLALILLVALVGGKKRANSEPEPDQTPAMAAAEAEAMQEMRAEMLEALKGIKASLAHASASAARPALEQLIEIALMTGEAASEARSFRSAVVAGGALAAVTI